MVSEQWLTIINSTNRFILSYPCQLEAETGVVPHSRLSRPLQQIVYGRVTTTIIKVLCIEGPFYSTLGEINHGYCPVLTAIGRIVLLGHDAGVVLTAIAITERQFALAERMDTIGSVCIETIYYRFSNAKSRCILCAGLCYRNERECTIALTIHGYLRSVGRNEENGFTHLALECLYLP